MSAVLTHQPPAPTVEVTDAVKRYRDGRREIVAVDRLTLAVDAGSLLAVTGPSGSGKTTLLGILGGLITPTSGDARICGRSVVRLRDHHRARWRRAHVGFVLQDLALIDGMTVLENALLPLAPRGGASSADVAQARTRLAHFGLADRVEVKARTLSGGERQRAAIVRALAHDPDVLLLDEPTAHLDQDNVSRVVGMLAELRDAGRTIVVATHDPRLYDAPAVDRAVRLVDGRLG